MNETDDFLVEIQESFLLEAVDLLDTVESLSLSLEKNPDDIEVFNKLSRLAHNFKGSGKAVGFDHISRFAHKIEDFILAIKSKQISPDHKNIDFLFKCLDRLKQDIETLKLNRASDLDHSGLIAKIGDIVAAGSKDSISGVVESAIEQINSGAINRTQVPSKKMIETKLSQKSLHNDERKGESIEYLRIAKSKIDFVLESFGEQVILQSMLEQNKYNLHQNSDFAAKTISQLTKLTLELQNQILSLTMIPLTQTFTKLERAIRDAAKQCGKRVEIEILGQNSEAGKPLVEALSDPLTHIVRNAVDHAIESEEERVALKKPLVGKVSISAERSGGQLWLSISDDGRGLDPQKLKEKAIQKNLVSEEDCRKMTDYEAMRLIFAPGFSTKEIVSEISGRGVGMNVVSEAVTALKGAIDIQSEVNVGTKFVLKVPLSLAIYNGAVIRVNGTRYVVPNSEISEITRIDPNNVSKISNSNSAIKIRDEIFQLIDLRKRFELAKGQSSVTQDLRRVSRTFPVILSRKNGNKAFLVEEIEGIQKIVQKQVGEELRSHPGFVAGTILSDGTPGVVIDLQKVIDKD
jgi:two-component system, chemotaxis family, sensor kinase CheA